MNRQPKTGEIIVLKRHFAPEYNGLTLRVGRYLTAEKFVGEVVARPTRPTGNRSSTYFIGEQFSCIIEVEDWELTSHPSGFKDWAKAHP